MTDFRKAIVETYGRDATIEMLFGILDELPVPLFLKNEDLRYIYVNKADAELDGKLPEECVGFTDFERHVKQTADQMAADDRTLLRSRKPIRKQATIKGKKGGQRHCLTHKQSIRFKKDGKSEKVIFGIEEDRSELTRKEHRLAAAEKSLDVSNRRIRQAVDSIDSGFVIWDQEDRLVLCNDAFRKQFGFLPNLAEGRRFRDMFLEFAQSGLVTEAVGREEEWVEEHLKTREAELGREIVFQTHDGRWLMRRDVRNENGDRVGIRTDITDIHKSREKLAVASETIENLSTAVLVKNAEGQYLLVNEKFGEWLGHKPSELIGKTARDVFDLETAKEIEARERRVLSSGRPYSFEETIRLASGGSFEAVTTIQRIDGQDGNFYICVSLNDVSEIKSREERLAEQAAQIQSHRNRMEQFAETSADWFWEMDADLRIIYLSEGARKSIGLDPEKVIGKTRRELWADKEDRDQIDLHLADLDARKEFKHFIYPMESPVDGSIMYISVSGTPVHDSAGEFTGYIGTGRNATEQVERQKALEAAKANLELSQQRFKAFAETNADWFWEMDANLRFSYFSDSFETVTGVAPERLLGKNRQETGIPGITSEEFEAHLDVLADHAPFRDFVHSRTRNDGSEIWLAISGTPIFDANGVFQGYQGSGRDVTDQFNHQKALEDSLATVRRMERIVDATFDNLPVGLSIYDENDRFVRCNATVVPEVFKLYNELGPGHHMSEALKQLYDHKVLNRVQTDDADFEEVSGRDGWVRQLQQFLSLPKSESFADVKGRRMRITNRRLENGLFISLWADVTDMHEAMRAAETADRAKSEFLANMSHEIRTPMNGVMGMAELLAKTELDAKQKMFTDVIVKSGASLLTIINDILDFSKLDAGQMELDPAPFNLTEAIEDVATLVSSRVAEKDLELIVRVDPALPASMIGDVGRIRQIVTNLMGNAVKFTEQGHVYVNVTEVKTCLETARKRLRFEVTDTGIGIPPEKCKAVFDKFSQVDTSSSRKHEGTGLGLTIASSLVEIMGGEIGVNSEVGNGSTFWFEIELPVDRANKKERHVPVDVTGARVLIVDDNEVNRSILSEQMAAWKFDSAAAMDGFEGLAVMRAAAEQNITIDCVVLDYQMPGMNGGEVVRRMRGDAMLKDIPVIMLTSVDQTEDGKAFSSLGIQAHLTKPTRSSQLLESIVCILQDKAATAEPVRENTVQEDPAQPAVAIEGQAETHTQPLADSERKSVPKLWSSGIDILVCEDNEVNQIVFTQILQSANYTFEIAPNGRKGVEMMKELAPKIILMDVSMPEMNGLQATAAIREYEKGSGIHTPIIGVTAHAIKGDMEKCLAAGMDDYLSKPVSPDRLQEKIANWMNTIRDVRQA